MACARLTAKLNVLRCSLDDQVLCTFPRVPQSKIKDTKEAMKQKAMEIERSKIESKKMTSMLPSSITGFGSKGGFGSDAAAAAAAEPVIIRSEPPAPRAPVNKGPAKGMQLGKAKKTNNFLESLAKEGEVGQSDNGMHRTPCTLTV